MTMKYTSAQANKRLKKLTDEYVSLREKESRSREFRAAAGENVESVRPAYDYADTQRRLAELERCIRRIKHAINLFNATHTVPGFDMTIDEMLVYIPQLTRRKNKLAAMKNRTSWLAPRWRWTQPTSRTPSSCPCKSVPLF